MLIATSCADSDFTKPTTILVQPPETAPSAILKSSDLVQLFQSSGVELSEYNPGGIPVSYCLPAPDRNYLVGSRGGLHIYEFISPEIAAAKAAAIPADGGCGPLDWDRPVHYFLCDTFIIFVTADDPVILRDSEASCGEPIATARPRF